MTRYFKNNREIIRDSAFDKKKKKRWLKFNPGLALTGIRTTGPRAKGKAPITIIIYLNSELGTNAKKSTDVHFCLREGFNGQETIAAAKSELELSLQSILKANNWSMENLKNNWTSIS